MSSDRGLVPLAVWLVVVALGLTLLHHLGQTTLAAPPLHDRAAALTWAQTTPPPVAAGCVVRLLAAALGWYLLLTTLAGLAGRVLRMRTAVRALDQVTLPPVRRLLQQAVGVGLTAQLGLLPAAAGAAEHEHLPRTVTMAALEETSSTMRALPGGWGTMRALDHGRAEMREIPGGTATMQPAAETTATMRALPADPPLAAPPTAEAAQPSSAWTVRPGDHLWAIAEVVVAFHGGDPHDEGVVAAYWHRLVEANRHGLVDPSNPDLILPGQQLVLPAQG